jgi:hypothetical protein
MQAVGIAWRIDTIALWGNVQLHQCILPALCRNADFQQAFSVALRAARYLTSI